MIGIERCYLASSNCKDVDWVDSSFLEEVDNDRHSNRVIPSLSQDQCVSNGHPPVKLLDDQDVLEVQSDWPAQEITAGECILHVIKSPAVIS